MPVPHDCVIEKIKLDGEYLVFEFENDISHRDSIKYCNHNARSLSVRYHLVDNLIEVFKKVYNPLIKGYVETDLNELSKPTNRKIEYIYHNVGYRSMIIKLYKGKYYLLDIVADKVEYEWIEKEL